MSIYQSMQVADLEDEISILTADMKELKSMNRKLANVNADYKQELDHLKSEKSLSHKTLEIYAENRKMREFLNEIHRGNYTGASFIVGQFLENLRGMK